MNKLIKTGVVCDLFDTYTCDSSTHQGSHWRKQDSKQKTENEYTLYL